jgi:dihydroorotate dehydrogenase subfamily 1
LSTAFLGKTLSGPFTIPSGIVTTAPSIIQYFLDEVPQLGIITTKSIGLAPRAGNREPVYSQYAPGCFVNAVGLTNPGAEAALAGLEALEVPEDRFLLTSIFGGSVEEFVRVAELLAPVSDGLELNLSCPHASGYGMAMGQDPELVREIVAAVKRAVDIPVIPKLTPNTPDIGAIARAAEEAGADGFCAINTVGPGYTLAHGEPVLSNGMGGMSGKGVLPIALKCIRDIRAVSALPIIGCGGLLRRRRRGRGHGGRRRYRGDRLRTHGPEQRGDRPLLRAPGAGSRRRDSEHAPKPWCATTSTCASRP